MENVVWVEIIIRCPETWYQRCEWIKQNCQDAVDRTNWQLWQQGLDDIYFWVRQEDAVIFKLLFDK